LLIKKVDKWRSNFLAGMKMKKKKKKVKGKTKRNEK
jgi:hypothetical protein